ncbi:hypothetical protein GUITHDRAFT_156491 [Guillardia theta CCMP2712]|uniref:Uncharacterized protein n=2 Tax=Guillardia theta TaxID=55529 RepID=L1I7E0_GUITC|nr:hypothetical protein GUITHDRAFT_156491 [Guillardia theta CCMP2712]EKX31765.1 hypothetical protein GUITHDRAFT_156491 [Guillardia theta CCMP2712]|mmetsp:Transcript_48468/g.152002  ORF Transcript_48468/g.152002 Transcript_48468/m.152002 type:complete len:174 (+) Transcript_48468:240-761(+)|eukprot:XP_005818745.1 hypothetical protein GUITHDRAFT_156491 [Guillardia theta CCMP2712]
MVQPLCKDAFDDFFGCGARCTAAVYRDIERTSTQRPPVLIDTVDVWDSAFRDERLMGVLNSLASFNPLGGRRTKRVPAKERKQVRSTRHAEKTSNVTRISSTLAVRQTSTFKLKQGSSFPIRRTGSQDKIKTTHSWNSSVSQVDQEIADLRRLFEEARTSGYVKCCDEKLTCT